jgi:acetylornithine deacetylase
VPKALSAREILDRLVAFPTVSRDSNLDLVDWVEDYLAGHGVSARRGHPVGAH